MQEFYYPIVAPVFAVQEQTGAKIPLPNRALLLCTKILF
jgi:hypothetical protein